MFQKDIRYWSLLLVLHARKEIERESDVLNDFLILKCVNNDCSLIYGKEKGKDREGKYASLKITLKTRQLIQRKLMAVDR